MAYCTYDEFTDWHSTTYSQALVEDMIDWATSMVDKLTGTAFVSTSASETFYGDGNKNTFYLTKLPVISISSVTEYDPDGNTTSFNVDHFIGDTGKVVLDDAITKNYRVVFSYNYGDTDNADLAKLLTIHLTKIGLEMMEQAGGVFPTLSVRKGDIEYALGKTTSENKGLLMNVWDLVDKLKYKRPIVIEGEGAGGYYERLRKGLR